MTPSRLRVCRTRILSDCGSRSNWSLFSPRWLQNISRVSVTKSSAAKPSSYCMSTANSFTSDLYHPLFSLFWPLTSDHEPDVCPTSDLCSFVFFSVSELSNHMFLMSSDGPQNVYQYFILSFLSQKNTSGTSVCACLCLCVHTVSCNE